MQQLRGSHIYLGRLVTPGLPEFVHRLYVQPMARIRGNWDRDIPGRISRHQSVNRASTGSSSAPAHQCRPMAKRMTTRENPTIYPCDMGGSSMF